jgi:hypothetical protein
MPGQLAQRSCRVAQVNLLWDIVCRGKQVCPDGSCEMGGAHEFEGTVLVFTQFELVGGGIGISLSRRAAQGQTGCGQTAPPRKNCLRDISKRQVLLSIFKNGKIAQPIEICGVYGNVCDNHAHR